MKTSLLGLIISAILLLNSGCQPGSDSSDAMPEAVASSEPGQPILLATVETYTEAPVIDKDGNAYISEPYRGPITKITPSGEVSIWSETEGANGHLIREDGSHLVCDRVRKEVLILNEMGEETGVAASTCGEHALRGPNDLALDSNGGLYFTDPSAGQDEPIGRVCYVDPNGESMLVAEWEGYPNGIGLSVDENELYVAASSKNALLSFAIESPGEVGPEKVLTDLPGKEDGSGTAPDGFKVASNGDIYLAHWRSGAVHVINSEGELINTISVSNKDAWTSNVTLAGPDEKTLYVTGNPGPKADTTGFLYKIEL